jgi:hypothetical protein
MTTVRYRNRYVLGRHKRPAQPRQPKRMTRAPALGVARLWLLSALGISLLGCGGGSTPTAPTQTRSAVVQATITTATATFLGVSASGERLQFELAGTVTFRETGGVAATVQRVTGSVILTPTGQTATTGSLDVSVALVANGSGSDSYTQRFDVPLDTTGATWRFTATGVDSTGRSFTVPIVDGAISFPAPAPPTPSTGRPDRVLVFGGRDYTVYLGCFSCNRFDPESIWNEFGSYGSAFSSTSINNQFPSTAVRSRPSARAMNSRRRRLFSSIAARSMESGH